MFFGPRRFWGDNPFKSSYEAVIIGGGVHGLATAYYLARDHGLTDVAVIERRYIGYGGAGRNTAIVRANQRTPENVRLYSEGLKLWPELIDELDFNLMFFDCGNLNLAHSEAGMGAFRLQVATAQFMGVRSELLDAKQCQELVPLLDISDRPKYPILGGMYHPPGGTVRHDAVVWGLARGAWARGVHIHQQTEVTGIDTADGRVTGVRTTRGNIRTPKVLIATGAYGAQTARLVGIRLPIQVLTIQAMVSQPLKPFLHHVVSSGTYHCYCHQSLKGELVTGAHMDPWPNYTTQVTAEYLKHQAEALTDLMPALKSLKFMRIWSGLADMTPDMAPIIDGNDPVEGLYLDCGWGYFGFKSGPITGRYLARFMVEECCPDILQPFSLKRYRENRLMGEISTPPNYGPWN
ncbi:FAD-dependent oxidoreductase [Desulfosoma caldarium]|uniref:N-methylglutamate dehydrogenase subunit A n=1 Tax=Desulfosoma caldarium TaxID=610254 RepID=A0A3N1ULQ6_9BACT|nr:FAD-dependent oxidoreductase [Desulfosoma caldarium]ROQ92155.1 N-methylglutamate dehydrogenase subunit A precursor [Desulfosoma caldarium]